MERYRLKNRELFSAVTHEIKNSLNPVINLSSILLRNTDDRLTADENSYLEVIERNGKKILNIVEEFSFLNRLTVKEKKKTWSVFSVREMIDNALMGMMELSSRSGCRLVCDIDEDSSSIRTEKDVFRRIIENICQFFIYSSGEEPSVYFNTSMSGTEFRMAISRKKTESSTCSREKFDEEFDKEKIIEKGYSAGTVMWLQFAVIYIYHLKGEVYVCYDDAGDVVFMFTIPAEQLKTGVKETDQSVKNDSVYAYNREFVMLVIDDDIDNIIPINAIIEHEFKGHGVVYHAESGSKGLDLLDKIKPDIILLDLTLPDISGLSLVRNIKHLFVQKNIPVLAFTGLEIADNREKMIKSGFDDVIKKPFNIDTFIGKIRKWIN